MVVSFLLFNQTQILLQGAGCTESVLTDISSRLERLQSYNSPLLFTADLLRKLVENPHKTYVVALGYFFTQSLNLTWATSLEARVYFDKSIQ